MKVINDKIKQPSKALERELMADEPDEDYQYEVVIRLKDDDNLFVLSGVHSEDTLRIRLPDWVAKHICDLLRDYCNEVFDAVSITVEEKSHE